VKRVLFLPCDTRPPTLSFVHQLADLAGVELVSPPPGLLNDLNRPGDTSALAGWLRSEAAGADTVVVTLETLTLGGMIPARRVTDPLDLALGRLSLLRDLKGAHPALRLLAYGVIVRVAHGDDPLEEKPYFGQWGGALRAFSEALDRAERGGDGVRLEEARAVVPPEILRDWLDTRERNHALHLAAVDMLAEGVLEHLCLTLDDTTPYGLAARDRRRLESRLDEGGLWARADVYPGADEVAGTLLARALVNASGRRPQVFVRYPSTLGEAAGMLYEDRPLGELVKAHLRAAGCVPASTVEDADLVLGVNAPAVRQSHRAPNWEVVDTASRNLPEFLDRLAEDVAAGREVAIADVAYANGAEPRFTRLMLASLPVHRLAGYAAWNTAGNTLGSAIAQGVCSLHGGSLRARAAANFARLVDDWLYQGRVRGEVRDALVDPSPYDLGADKARAEEETAERILPLARALWNEHFAPHLPGLRLELGRPSLAWPRLFTGVFPFALVEGEA
jgi:hypothetical protein